ncbi:MAG: ABC transporter ATP-binding protein [Candidatus Methylacidiphilales bacterium]
MSNSEADLNRNVPIACPPILEARGVGKVFRSGLAPELEILKGVDLILQPCECLLIHGASGSGKTTLLNIMGGLDSATSGRVFWSGQPVDQWGGRTAASRRNRHVAFVFQQYHLLPELNALENVLLSRWIRREEDRGKAQWLMERVGLAERMHHRPFELSGGEQQRVAVARALYQEPEVILADEPTGNLDAANSLLVVGLLKDLAHEQKKALVMVTHDFTLRSVGDRVMTLSNGRVVSDTVT